MVKDKGIFKSRPFFSVIFRFTVWITSILVSLAVGFAMIGQNGEPVLTIPYIPEIVTIIAGWIVVIFTILNVILSFIERS